MPRPAALLLTLPLALACKPPESSFDAGCYPAPFSYPAADAGPTSNCTSWAYGCDSNGVQQLTTEITKAFQTAGVCTQNTDCALYGEPDGGYAYQSLCYQTTYTPPINASQRATLDANLQAIFCGFCSSCFDGGGLLQGDVAPPQDAGNCVEVDCVTGQCQQTSQ